MMKIIEQKRKRLDELFNSKYYITKWKCFANIGEKKIIPIFKI